MRAIIQKAVVFVLAFVIHISALSSPVLFSVDPTLADQLANLKTMAWEVWGMTFLCTEKEATKIVGNCHEQFH